MSRQESEPYGELPARIDQQPSIYNERIKARSYSDQYPNPGDYLVSDAVLSEKGKYWSDRYNSPEVSPRGREEIMNILSAIALEKWFRVNQKTLELSTDIEDYPPEEWAA